MSGAQETAPGLAMRLESARGDFRLAVDWQSGGARRIGVFGASGAGKSTLLHILAGLLRPSSGELRFGAERWFASASAESGRCWVPPERRGVGYVFQDARVFPHLSVAQNLEFGASLRAQGHRGDLPDGANRQCTRAAVLERLALDDLLTARGHALSGGQQKRVAIARALYTQPRLLLCDEAEAGLDAANRAGFAGLLKLAAADGAVIVRVSHELPELFAWSQELLVCANGELVFAGRPHDLPDTLVHGSAVAMPLRAPSGIWLRSDRLHWLPRSAAPELSAASANMGSFAQILPARVLERGDDWIRVGLESAGQNAASQAVACQQLSIQSIPHASTWQSGEALWCAVPANAIVHDCL